MSANMFSQRAVQQSVRRRKCAAKLSIADRTNIEIVAATRHTTLSKSMRFASPLAIATGQIRQAATATPSTPPSGNSVTVSQTQAYDLLAAQRRNRPVSPHLGIYKLQITMALSGLERITGSILSGGLYIFGFAYLVAPYLGMHLESASMAAAFAAWPVALKVLTKLTLALPFTLHSFNAVRYLIWDTGAAFSNKQVIVTGWTVIALSVVTALGLTFY